MACTRKPSRRWLAITGFLLVLIAAAGGILYWHARHMDNFVRLWVIRSLSEHFHSSVELAAIRVSGFPQLSVTGEDLTIHFDGRTDVPPLIHIDKLSLSLGVLAILRLPRHVSMARIENMTITVPPRGEKPNPKPKEQEKANNVISSLIIDEVICKNTVLITLPREPDPGKPKKEPLEWDIHDLDFTSASLDKPFHFHGKLTN
ncbi:MAG TPA: hypothetical protein VKH63_13130, partial [Candidatus Acidoferrum sp.]|nr:hypothetical protein [Candidatus Acidoferrum sp.]